MKVLIIRFTSLGDVVQCFPVADAIKLKNPDCHISFMTRSDLAPLLKLSPAIDRILAFDKQTGFKGLIKQARDLAKEDWTLVYDAHNNVRSHVLMFFFRFFRPLGRYTFVRRKKHRFKRFLFFNFGCPTVPQPFRSMISFLRPLRKWEDLRLPPPPLLDAPKNNYIVLAPSASSELKRWPIEYFGKVIATLADKKFAVVGGPQDQFVNDLVTIDPERVINFAGRLNWEETGQLVLGSSCVVSNDTGVAHIADWLAIPTIAIRGAAAFGHTTRTSSILFEAGLDCQPCSKDGKKPCHNQTYKKCLLDISPEMVINKLKELLP